MNDAVHPVHLVINAVLVISQYVFKSVTYVKKNMQHDAMRGDVQHSVASARLRALFLILRWSRRTPLMEKPEVYWLANLWLGCLRVCRQDLSTPLRNLMRTQSQAGPTDLPYFSHLTSLWYLDSFYFTSTWARYRLYMALKVITVFDILQKEDIKIPCNQNFC